MQRERRLRKLAASQNGVVSRKQALEAGISPQGIGRRLASDEWEKLLPSVYRLTNTRHTWLQWLYAAWLWGGLDAVVSHRASGVAFQLEGVECDFAELWVPRSRRSPTDDLIVHTGSLASVDIARWRGLLVTTPTRTLIDLGSVVEEEALEFALEDALRRGLTTIDRLERAVERLSQRGRPGVPRMRHLLGLRGDAPPTASQLETLFARLVRGSSLPDPARQYEVVVDGKVEARPDFAYPDTMLAIECESFKHHSGRRGWSKDVRRMNKLIGLGWHTYRVTWDDVTTRGADVVAEIGSLLESLRDPSR